ncbi:MAG TPA: hypothetical protein VFP72_07795 [Kineosporiaceae bacterium]|nr:hypothetical protein [Kineosporiaceae bacterium]
MSTHHQPGIRIVHGRIWFAAAAVALAGTTLTGLVITQKEHGSTGSGTVQAAERSTYDNGLGYVTAAASPAPKAAMARQSLRPVPLVAGTGPCLGAMDAVRQIMHAVPSGGLLASAPGWARLLGPRMGTVNQACGARTAQAFRDQEVLPWTNALIPSGVKIPPAPQK